LTSVAPTRSGVATPRQKRKLKEKTHSNTAIVKTNFAAKLSQRVKLDGANCENQK